MTTNANERDLEANATQLELAFLYFLFNRIQLTIDRDLGNSFDI